MGIPTNVITPDSLITSTQESRYRSTGFELFGTGVGEGLQYSTPGALGRLASWYGAGQDEHIDEETWKTSQHYRDGLKYDPSLTNARAEIMAYRHDIDARRSFIKAHAESSGSAAVLGFLGNIAGNLPDPVNYIPVLGQGAKAWMIAKFGRIAATAAKGAAEATAGSLITQPLIVAAERQSQGDYDITMAAQNVLASTAFGGLFGTVAGHIEKIKLKTHTDAVSKSVDDMAAGKPVDTALIMRNELERIKQEKLSMLDNLKKQKSEIETRLSVEQPFARHEDVLNAIRQDVERTTEIKYIGYEKREILQIVDKSIKGQELTEKQNRILSDIIEIKKTEYASGFNRKDILNAIRQDVERGYAGTRLPVRNEFGVTVNYEGISSGFPEYFRSKGYRKEEVLNIIDKAVKGEKLTEKQNRILSDTVEGKTSEFESARHIIETENAQKVRPSAVIQDIGLETGDRFKIYGESYTVKGFNEEGKIILGTGLQEGETVITLDTLDKLPLPDEGSLVKKITPELAAVNKQISDLETEIAGEKPIDFSTNEEAFEVPEEAVIKENEMTGQVDMEDEIPELEAQIKEMESEAMLIDEDVKAIEDVKQLEKDASVFGKVYKAAVDCILRGE